MHFPRKTSGIPEIAALALLSCLALAVFAGAPGFGQKQEQKPKSFPLLNWSGMGCRAKGRLQDRDYCRSKIMDQILAQGTDAVPILISQIMDARALKEPAFDFWNSMTVGDLAAAILGDLFTDSDWQTFNMPGLERVTLTVCDPKVPAYECWQSIVKEHGRKFIQDQWLAAWNKNKDRVYWDTKAGCFRLSPNHPM
jgi:hypothetical protein